jgi:hypothetical protein
MKIKLVYESNYNFLTKTEWVNLITFLISKIESTNIGSMLINQLNHYSDMGHTVTIKNYSSSNINQFPHIKINKTNGYFRNTIYIPDTPYFINVPVFNKELIELQTETIIHELLNSTPLATNLDNDFVNSFSKFEYQPYVITLFHELVHCLRSFNNIASDGMLEEYSTIYGIQGNTLIIDGNIITENSFRKEVGLMPRLSHDSSDDYIYNVTRDTNYSNQFLKEKFYQFI